MAQAVLCCTLVVLVLLGLCAGGVQSACKEVNNDNLKFCFQGLPSGAFNGHNSSSTAVLDLVDGLFSAIWPSVEQAVNQAASKHGFSVCQDCMTALKHMTCSAYVPGCNYTACYAEASSKLIAAYYDCAGINPADAQGCANGINDPKCQTFLAKVYAAASSSYDLSVCISRKQAEILSDDACFRSQVVGRTMCENFVDVCLCSPGPDVKNEVCQFFPAEGYNIDFPSGLSCSGTSGWCANKKRAVGSTGANQACPNSNVCMAVPQSNSYAGYGAVVQTSTSAASALVPSFVISLFSLF